MTDFDQMFKQYPQIILVSKSPVTWIGFLTISNRIKNVEKKVKLKLILPSFPNLDKASVLFGGNIAVLFGPKFKKQIASLSSSSESVPVFLQELRTLIEKLFNERETDQVSNDLIQSDMREKLLKELETDVQLSSTKDFSVIKLTMNDISMTVQPTVNSAGQNSWRIVSSDLPNIPDYSLSDKKTYSLKEIRKRFEKQVDMLERVYYQLRKIDSYCWVIDPIYPKPYHLYRRIHLSPSLSLYIKLNPLDPSGYPIMKFVGADVEVEKYKDKIAEEDFSDKWDDEYSVHENLLTLLNIDEFPQVPINFKPVEKQGIIDDEECCICFSMELDNGEIPDEICENQKCRRRFHTICLFQWLQETAANKIIFNKISGPCPNCGELKSCNIPLNT
ncbi:E3 ubiquitin-protein ligase FANCL isoform X2 [Phymastichus coffea]|uniref:E3 ubiquitin-protein ligase FANCL isoform X2 n=1 Tax=Phymastichus coffea TaxID=108790 RepID=UPI00273B84EA|nr:E3 ubiquitin-protein ligase FANCL isoform X2 [Phymastichus coffea]